jgi:hypothetical protein
MSYSLLWKTPALPFAQKQTPISVPAGTVVSNAASLRFTGKGATNYGKIQQENLLRLLENFAGSTAPDYPTVGQLWFDTNERNLKICIATPGTGYPAVEWQQINSMQVTAIGEVPPPDPELGDTWFSYTGSASGIMYLYTGIGRYPETNFDASTYWPSASSTLGIKLNTTTFTGVNTAYNEAYIHGYIGGTATDINGSILINGISTPITKGTLQTKYPVTNGYIVWDQGSTFVGAGIYYVVQQSLDGSRWFYDNNSTLVEFTPTANMYVIGRVTVSEQDDNTAPGITSGTMFSTAIRLEDIMQVPATLASGAIGGWEQVWPTVQTHGGRAEYEYIFGQLMSLIGDPAMFGGSGALGKAIPWLTDFRTLDASMQKAWKSMSVPDTNVSSGTSVSSLNGVNSLKVEVNSRDWDKLLAACRYAVNRLELPPGISDDISIHPFVQDGLSADPTIVAISGIRAIPNDRRQRNRIGSISLFSAYQETLNVLRAGIQNRYLLKGILEASGVNSLYSNASTTTLATYTANSSGLSGTVSTGIDISFGTTQPDLEQFFYSGAAIQFVLTHTPSASPTAADNAFRAITNASGRVRVTANNTFIMTPAVYPIAQLSQAPTNIGFTQMTAAGTTLGSISGSGVTIIIRGLTMTLGSIRILVDINAGGALTGSTSIAWSYICDGELYSGSSFVYAHPSSSTKQGSSLFV